MLIIIYLQSVVAGLPGWGWDSATPLQQQQPFIPKVDYIF